MFRIGVDLGGTKIEAIALADDGSIPVRLRVPTPRHDYAGTLTAIAALVAEIEAGHRAARQRGRGHAGRAARPPPASSRMPIPSG